MTSPRRSADARRARRRHVFGVVGSGNFHVTNALVAAGARFVPPRTRAAPATMADAYARVSGTVGVLSVHQGPGVTNALTGHHRGGEEPYPAAGPGAGGDRNPRSNFYLDLAALAAAIGAAFRRRAGGVGAG